MCILIWKLTNMQKSFIEIKLKLRGKFQTYETITLADIWLFCLIILFMSFVLIVPKDF